MVRTYSHLRQGRAHVNIQPPRLIVSPDHLPESVLRYYPAPSSPWHAPLCPFLGRSSMNIRGWGQQTFIDPNGVALNTTLVAEIWNF